VRDFLSSRTPLCVEPDETKSLGVNTCVRLREGSKSELPSRREGEAVRELDGDERLSSPLLIPSAPMRVKVVLRFAAVRLRLEISLSSRRLFLILVERGLEERATATTW